MTADDDTLTAAEEWRDVEAVRDLDHVLKLTKRIEARLPGDCRCWRRGWRRHATASSVPRLAL